jgi:hypothetical protein
MGNAPLWSELCNPELLGPRVAGSEVGFCRLSEY